MNSRQARGASTQLGGRARCWLTARVPPHNSRAHMRSCLSRSSSDGAPHPLTHAPPRPAAIRPLSASHQCPASTTTTLTMAAVARSDCDACKPGFGSARIDLSAPACSICASGLWSPGFVSGGRACAACPRPDGFTGRMVSRRVSGGGWRGRGCMQRELVLVPLPLNVCGGARTRLYVSAACRLGSQLPPMTGAPAVLAS